MEYTMVDDIWMNRALQLAAYGAGHVSPNPMVGAVIVSESGRVLGEGWHRRYGGPHAEVNAFADVRSEDEKLLPEATIYVTLEPCSHYGKTPPCAELLIKKRIRRAVIGCGDPNPKVAGRGIAMLRQAGIEVSENVLTDDCRWLNRRFITAHTLHRPWILLKWARTADGFMAHDTVYTVHTPLRISTPLSASLMHRERSLCDAIMVGTNTMLADKPSLSTRLWPGNSPRPVIFRSSRLSPDSVANLIDPIWIDPKFSLTKNMEILFSLHGITSLMVEGGASLLKSFVDAGLYDEIRIETATFSIGTGLKDPL